MSRAQLISLACTSCRQKRTKCDGLTPCARCAEKDIDCTYVGDGRKSGRTIDSLRKENDFLRSLLASHNVNIPSDNHAPPPTPISTASSSRSAPSSSSRTESPRQPTAHSTNSTADMPIIDPDSGETTHYGFSSFLPLIDVPRPASLSLANLPPHVIRSSNLPSTLHLELLDLFYKYQNGIYTFINRQQFCDDSHTAGVEYSLFVHLCILATAAHLSDCPDLRSDRDNPATAGIGLAAEAWQLLPSELIRPRVSTVVGLCLLSNIASQFGGGDGLGWIVIGLAVRIVYHLGLNIKCRSGVEGCDARDRAFWAVYHSDKIWSFYFGREAALMDEIGEVGLVSPPEIRLTVLLGALGKEIYSPHHKTTAAALKDIDKALTEFDLSLSLTARMEASPQTICLQTTALTARLLIMCPVVRTSPYDTRLEIATQITTLLNLYERKHTLRLAPLPMPYHAYISAATMLDLRVERSDPRSADILRQLVDALSAMAGAWLTACEALIAIHRRAELKLGPSTDKEDLELLDYLAAKVHKRSGVGYTHGQNDAVADMFSDLLFPGYSIPTQ